MKFVAFITLLCFSLPSFGQQAVTRGTVISEEGIFLTKSEAAKIATEKEAQDKQCKIDIKYEIDRVSTMCMADKSVKDIALQSEKDKNAVILSMKDQEIVRLYKEVEKESGQYDLWWFAGGIAIGAVSAITIFYATVQIQQSVK